MNAIRFRRVRRAPARRLRSRDDRSRQAVSEIACQRGRRRLLRRGRRRGVRPARPERGREDDDGRDADDARPADCRCGSRRRCRRHARSGTGARPSSQSCRSGATSTARSRSATTSSSTPPTTASRRASASARADELLDQFGLLERGGDKPDFFSGGQAQRVMIARALMHDPQVLFLDEPTTGLDPAARLFVWDRLRELRDAGVTLVLTTHDMDEAAALADRVGIMDHGKLLALDTPEALMRSLPGRGARSSSTGRPAGRRGRSSMRSSALAGVERVETRAGRSGNGARDGDAGSAAARAPLPDGRRAAARRARGGCPRRARAQRSQDVKLGTPTLEDVFIHLTGTDAAMSADRRAGARAADRQCARLPRRPATATSTSPGNELPAFLAQVILQPFFLLFVFGKVLGELGYTQHGYADLLFPGLLALTAVLTACRRSPSRSWSSSAGRRRSRTACSRRCRRPRRRREDRLRLAPRARRDADHDPDRDPDPRLDPVALEPACRSSSRRSCSAALVGAGLRAR